MLSVSPPKVDTSTSGSFYFTKRVFGGKTLHSTSLDSGQVRETDLWDKEADDKTSSPLADPVPVTLSEGPPRSLVATFLVVRPFTPTPFVTTRPLPPSPSSSGVASPKGRSR